MNRVRHIDTFSTASLACMLACLGAQPSAAQDNFDLSATAPAPKKTLQIFTNYLEVGLGYQSADSYHFARYGGVRDEGPLAFLKGGFSGRSAWDSGDRNFWDITGSWLGEDMRSLNARTGQQGQWQVSGFYNSFTRAYTESAKSPFNGVGTSRLTLPSNWVSGAQSSRFTALDQNAKPLDLKTRWQSVGGDFVLAPPETGFELRFHFDRRYRDGLKADSITFGHEANFPVGIFFPQPVDYVSNRLAGTLSYANQKLQWNASYQLDTFNNNIKSITVPNVFSRSTGPSWPAGAFAGYPFAFGQYSLPPDNTAHQFSLSGGYTVTPKARLTAKLSYAIQKQNEPFFPYTINSLLDVPEALPRTSLNGDIRKTFANVSLTSRELPEAEFIASYTYDKRNNRTPRSLYSYIPNDVQDQAQPLVPGVSRYIRYNLPRSFTFHKAKAEAAYRINPRTRLSINYTGDFKSRTYQQVENSDEHAFKAKVLSTLDAGSGWVSYSYADRKGSEYRDDLPWNASHTLNYLNAGPQNQSIEHPLLRRFDIAYRTRREAKGGLTVDASTSLTLNASGGYARDNYAHSPVGLQRAKSLLLDGDMTYAVQDSVTASAFYSFERISSDQKGYYIATLNLSSADQAWAAHNKDTIHTAGVRLDWQVIPQQFKLGASYTASRGKTQIGVQATPFTPLAVVAPLPDAKENTHNVGLRGDYNVDSDTTVKIAYLYERHRSLDWQYDNVSLTPVAQILGSGITPPRYNVHVVSVSALYQF